jgi:hypothetical protein
MVIKAERIERNLRDFSFPRLSGTKHEKRAFTLAKKKIHELNLSPKVQKFVFSTFYSRIYPKIAFPLVFWIILSIYLNFDPIFLIINISVVSGFYLPFFVITRNPENIRIGKILKSQNLFVRLDPDNKKVNKNNKISDMLFIAHYDSKGQRFVARVRFFSILFWTLSLIALGIILVLRNVFFHRLFAVFSFIGIFPLGINFLATVILVSNTTNNKSKGVVDNASGVACLLELLTHFSNNNIPTHIRFWFALLGAEEVGTMGVRHFYEIVKNLDKEKTVVHNFESLGKKMGIFISKNNLENIPTFYNLFERKAKDYKFRTWVSGLTRGVHTDGIYLLRKGFNLYEHGSTEAGKFMHSKNDKIENVEIPQLQKLCEFIVELLDEYNK